MVIRVHEHYVSRQSSSSASEQELQRYISTMFMRSLSTILRTSDHCFTIAIILLLHSLTLSISILSKERATTRCLSLDRASLKYVTGLCWQQGATAVTDDQM